MCDFKGQLWATVWASCSFVLYFNQFKYCWLFLMESDVDVSVKFTGTFIVMSYQEADTALSGNPLNFWLCVWVIDEHGCVIPRGRHGHKEESLVFFCVWCIDECRCVRSWVRHSHLGLSLELLMMCLSLWWKWVCHPKG